MRFIELLKGYFTRKPSSWTGFGSPPLPQNHEPEFIQALNDAIDARLRDKGLI